MAQAPDHANKISNKINELRKSGARFWHVAQQNPSFTVNLWVDKESAVEKKPSPKGVLVESDFVRNLQVQKEHCWHFN